jgi:3-oxoadipate enol-lactonase
VERIRYAGSGDQRIAYRLHGAWWPGRPWLVLVQGLGFDGTGWAPVLGTLGRRMRLVLVDNRGSGRSTPTTRGFSVAAMSDDVRAVLDDAGIARAHLLGISLGGMIAQEVAVRHPERIDRLILVSTTPGWPSGYPMPSASLALLASSRRLPPEVALRRNVENALSPRTVAQRPELVDQLVDHERAHLPDLMSWRAQLLAGAGYAGQRRQTRICAPTLVVHGDDDGVVDPRNGALLASRIPGARLVRLPGCGHLCHWEDPHGFSRTVLSFLRTKPDNHEAVSMAVT